MLPKVFIGNVFPGSLGMFHRPIPAKVLRDGPNGDAKSVVVPFLGKVGEIDASSAPQFKITKFELKPLPTDAALMAVLFAERSYGVNLDKLPDSGNNSKDDATADSGRDGTPPPQAPC